MDQAKSVRIARDSVPVDKTALQTAVSGANTNKATAVVSIDGSDVDQDNHWVTQVEMTAYETAISNAQAVLDKADATQGEVDAQVTALDTATGTFNSAKKPGTKVITNVEKSTEYLPQNGDITVSSSGNITTIGGIINKYPTNTLGFDADSNLFEIKLTLKNVNKDTAVCRIVGPDKTNDYAAGNWIDDPNGNFFYFAGEVETTDDEFIITIDNDGNWTTTNDAVIYHVIIAEGTTIVQ